MIARILVIEDNPANLELARYLLTVHGYAVLTASDGRQGLDSALRERPDLILCDLQMPWLDGYQVLQQLRGQLDAVVIALTAFSMPNDRQQVLSAGFDGYLSKPIDPERFVAEVEAFLRPENRAPQSAARALQSGR